MLRLLHSSKTLNPRLLRHFSNPPQWTDTVHYLDESGKVISTAPGLRPAAPNLDSTILDGSLARPISRPQAAAKIAELALRWRWGPDLDRHLDRLPFPPDPKLVVSALSSIPSHDHEPALSLFRWARRQPWFVASDDVYVVLLERLFAAKDFEGIQRVFDDILEVVEGKHADFEGNLGGKGDGENKGDAFGRNWGSNGDIGSSMDDVDVKDFLSAGHIGPHNAALRGNWGSGAFGVNQDFPGELEAKGATFEGIEGSAAGIDSNGAAFKGNWGSAGSNGSKGTLFRVDLGSFSGSLNLAVQYLCRASMIEVCYCCFKKLKDAGFKGFSSETYNLLISLFLSKGLPYKAFEIYETMEGSGCSLDVSTFDLMIPALAKSGRLDAAIRLFNGLKAREGDGKPGLPIYLALVDCMGKAGRLDAAMELYREMQSVGYRPMVTMYVSMIESLVKAGKLDAGLKLWDEMKSAGFRPNFGLCTLMVETQARSGRLEVAASTFSDMEKSGFLPTPSTYACLVEMHSAAGQVDLAMRLYNSMTGAGLRPGLSTFTALLTVLAKKKLLDMAGKILLEMKAVGFAVDVHASDILMIYIKDGSTDLALRWLRFMGSAGIRTNNFIVRQLFESCMKAGLYDSARPLLETYVGSAAKVDLILYTSILAHLVRCQEEKNERAIMDILSTTRHKAHEFMCELFTGPEQRKQPVLSLVREFFQGIDYEAEESAAKYFVNVLLNYLVLMGQLNRARCVWKVAYENKLFPKAIVFDQHIAWSLDVRNLSVGAALVAVVHTLHRFRKRMLYYGAVPRRIKLVTGPTLKMVIAQILESVESPFEVSKVVLRAPGDSVSEWFNKPIVRQFLLNEIPSKADVLMHKLNVLFPSSAPEVRSLSLPRSMPMSR